MGYRTLPYTFQRNGNYYLQIRRSNGRMYKKSLLTDSYREASALLISITPHIPFVQLLTTPLPVFESFLSNLIASAEILEFSPPAEPKKVLALSDAWTMYKYEKGRNWTKSISMANDCYTEVLLAVLGGKLM